MTIAEIPEALADKTAEMRSNITAPNDAEVQDSPRTRLDQLEREVPAPHDQLARETKVADLERKAATAVGGDVTPDFDQELSRYSRLATAHHATEIDGELRQKDIRHAPAYLNDGKPRQ